MNVIKLGSVIDTYARTFQVATVVFVKRDMNTKDTQLTSVLVCEYVFILQCIYTLACTCLNFFSKFVTTVVNWKCCMLLASPKVMCSKPFLGWDYFVV